VRLFEWAGFARRNPSWVTRNARRSWAVTKAMRAFRQDNPESWWSGKPTKEVHHIVPVSVDAERAGDPSNMFPTAGRDEHYVVGHLGISWSVYNRSIVAVTERVEAIDTR